MEDGCAPLRNWTKSVDRANWEMKDGRTDSHEISVTRNRPRRCVSSASLRGDHSFTKPLTRSPRESRAPIETNGSDSGHRLYSYTPGIGRPGWNFVEMKRCQCQEGEVGREGKGREVGQGRLYTLSGWRDDESAILRREQEDRTADGRERGRVRSTSACIETPPPQPPLPKPRTRLSFSSSPAISDFPPPLM